MWSSESILCESLQVFFPLQSRMTVLQVKQAVLSACWPLLPARLVVDYFQIYRQAKCPLLSLSFLFPPTFSYPNLQKEKEFLSKTLTVSVILKASLSHYSYCSLCTRRISKCSTRWKQMHTLSKTLQTQIIPLV